MKIEVFKEYNEYFKSKESLEELKKYSWIYLLGAVLLFGAPILLTSKNIFVFLFSAIGIGFVTALVLDFIKSKLKKKESLLENKVNYSIYLDIKDNRKSKSTTQINYFLEVIENYSLTEILNNLSNITKEINDSDFGIETKQEIFIILHTRILKNIEKSLDPDLISNYKEELVNNISENVIEVKQLDLFKKLEILTKKFEVKKEKLKEDKMEIRKAKANILNAEIKSSKSVVKSI